MKILVTGVGGQLGHDVMNELAKRGHEGIGTDLAESYAGVQDDTYVTKAEYVSLDITDKDSVNKVIDDIKPDAVIHCAAWTAVDLAEDEDKILEAIDEAIQVMLLTSPYYTERFLGMRPERKNDIITANHANMCCGAGICGACSYTDKDGVTVRRCRCID